MTISANATQRPTLPAGLGNKTMLNRLDAGLTFYNARPRLRIGVHLGGWIALGCLNSFANLSHVVFEPQHTGYRTAMEIGQWLLVYYAFAGLFIRLGIERRQWVGIVLFLLVYYLSQVAYTYATAMLVVQGTLIPKSPLIFQFWEATYKKGVTVLVSGNHLAGMISSLATLPITLKAVKFLAERTIRRVNLEQQTLQLELDVLKAQVSPHFLFNTLNNVYSLALKKDPHTAGTIRRLRALMAYILHQTQAVRVPIREELTFIEAYLELERIRHGKRATIELLSDLRGNDQRMIPPLLLLPLVENAVKHGLNRSVGPVFARFTISVINGRFHFLASNTLPTVETKQPGGLGLQNIRQRLVLLYPYRHALRVAQTTTQFEVTLTLELD